jgi:CheY-like chemotaxis protein
MKALGDAPAPRSEAPAETYGMVNLDEPVQEVQEERKAPEVRNPQSPEEVRLLFIEDELNPHEDLVDMMIGFNYQLNTAKNAPEGQAAIRSQQYDLIFMAINLFSMGEVAEVLQLRTDLGYSSMPIIGVLDQPTSEEEGILISMGLTKCVASPFTEEEMRAVITEFVPLDSDEAEEEEPPEEEPQEADEEAPEAEAETDDEAEEHAPDELVRTDPLEEIQTEPSLQE